jgi:outer membrane protein TolC
MQLINVNYQAGAATQIDISDANTALEASELGLIAETLNSQLSALKVLKAAGAFNPQP